MVLKKPGIYLTEEIVSPIQGFGGKIPCFIAAVDATGGATGNPTEPIKANNKNELYSKIENPGTELYCKPRLEEFYTEVETYNDTDYGVPYVYFISVGDGATLNSWVTAVETANTLKDISVIVFIGNENLPVGKDLALLKATSTALINCHRQFDSYQAYFTIKIDDTKSENIIDTTYILPTAANVTLPRINFIEPNQYGKFIARVCVTPFFKEMGKDRFNTVEPGTFYKRTSERIESLLNAGVIIGVDEKISKNKFEPKICLGVSTTMSESPAPADAVLQKRLIADAFLDEVYETIYPRIKSNEMCTQIVYTQVDLDNLVRNWVNMGYLLPLSDEYPNGSHCICGESDENPNGESDENPNYMVIQVHILPVNSVIAIKNEVTIETNKVNITGGE